MPLFFRPPCTSNLNPPAYNRTSPGNFPYFWDNGYTAQANVYFDADADASTWQAVDVRVALPSDTTFIAVQIAAIENVYNDYSGTEFDGHCADGVVLRVVPEPASAGILILAGVAALRRRGSV